MPTDYPSAPQLISKIATFIETQQHEDGAIPWFTGGKLDPWDHCEALMALTIAGKYDAAYKAMHWLQQTQQTEGYWYAAYFDHKTTGDHASENLDSHKIDTNFVAYPATALWHHFLITENKHIVETFFPMIEKAIDYVIGQQQPEGDIQWARSSKEALPNDALITACSSILRSLECAIATAKVLHIKKETWERAYRKLANALRHTPERFDRTWESKERFSMDWFYPILAGIFQEKEAQKRFDTRWQDFIHSEFGCKCVADEPWITIAESSECVMALIAAGRNDDALRIFQQLLRWQDDDGGFWTGYVYRDDCIWPQEKTSWTAAAVALAADALFDLTPGAKLFTQPSHLLFTQDTQ